MENSNSFRVTMMCRLLKVSKAGYYAWCKRDQSKRAVDDARLSTRIKLIHKTSRRTYGSPRIHAQLQKDGVRVGRKRVARLMKLHAIEVKTRRRYKATTNSKHDLPVADNILDRRFDIDEIAATDRVWAGDITYVWTLEGWALSRRRFGSALAPGRRLVHEPKYGTRTRARRVANGVVTAQSRSRRASSF